MMGAVIAVLLLLGTAGRANAGSWAWVNESGSLTKQRGVIANYRDSPGVYRIVFRRSLTKCVPMVTSARPFYTVRAVETGNPGEVEVFLQSSIDLTYLDGSFYIALVC
jgi:hypothetical protein